MSDLDTAEAQCEEQRVARLLDAQAKAEALFEEIGRRGIIRPGVLESAASNEIRDLAADLFGVSRHWHKRIVRSGPNTLQPYDENPPDRAIEPDDIAFADFGPIFEAWEADFGRTFVLGDDPVKHRIREDLPRLFDLGRAHFHATADITGEQLYDHVVQLAGGAGWEFGGEIAGQLIGEFPHALLPGDKVGSDQPMRRRDKAGEVCHWILEIHLVDRERAIGGFYEQLLDI